VSGGAFRTIVSQFGIMQVAEFAKISQFSADC
jgi:hypothetical protein